MSLSNKRKMLLLGLTLYLMTSCVTPTPIVETKDDREAIRKALCGSFRLITFSRVHDTTQTIREVKRHNEVYSALCPSEVNSEKKLGEVDTPHTLHRWHLL